MLDTNSDHHTKATTDLFVLNCGNGSEGEIVSGVRKTKEILRFQQIQKACYTSLVLVSNCPKKSDKQFLTCYCLQSVELRANEYAFLCFVKC